MPNNFEKKFFQGKLGLVDGFLSAMNGRAHLSFWPVEVSQFRMVVLTTFSKLSRGFEIDFAVEKHKTKLEVTDYELSYKGSFYNLVTLVAKDTDVHIEQWLNLIPDLSKAAEDNGTVNRTIQGQFLDKLGMRAARFETRELLVMARTFGTRGDFKMRTEDISKTGILLQETEAVPFALNTLIELIIDPESEYFEDPIRCLGKVVRQDPAGEHSIQKDRGYKFGIKLIDLDDVTLRKWITFVEKLERSLTTKEKIAG